MRAILLAGLMVLGCGSAPDSTFGQGIPEQGDGSTGGSGGAHVSSGGAQAADSGAICEAPALSPCIDLGEASNPDLFDCALRCQGNGHRRVMPGACDGVTGVLFKEPRACAQRDLTAVVATFTGASTTYHSAGSVQGLCCCALCL